MKEALARLNDIGIDTSLVLLFLAVEVGRVGNFGSIEALVMSVAMLMLLVLPYFLPAAFHSELSLKRWLAYRSAVMAIGMVVGTVLPEAMSFFPMNVVIVAGICSCVVQFYGLWRPDLAK